MRFLYQWLPGSYSHQAAGHIAQKICSWTTEMVGCTYFDEVREQIDDQSVAILPIANSYAGSVHINMYRFLQYSYRIYYAYDLGIDHCLLWLTKDIQQIKEVYSHRQALEQCRTFCQSHKITQIGYTDTAGAAAMIVEKGDASCGAIASSLAAELYGLQIIQKSIQDSDSNTTRFFVVGKEGQQFTLPQQSERVVMIFSVRNGQWILYKCLWAFATHGIDLTKIESLPSQQDPFTYLFWVECKTFLENTDFQDALAELQFFTHDIRILWAF